MLDILVKYTWLQALIKLALLILAFVMPLASLSTWAERRQSAMMQDRLGPNRADIFGFRLWGITHFIADALKMMFKEDLVPAKVDKFLYAFALFLVFALVFFSFVFFFFG